MFTLVYWVFRLLPINSHGRCKTSTEIHFYLTKKHTRACNTCSQRQSLGSFCDVTPDLPWGHIYNLFWQVILRNKSDETIADYTSRVVALKLCSTESKSYAEGFQWIQGYLQSIIHLIKKGITVTHCLPAFLWT